MSSRMPSPRDALDAGPFADPTPGVWSAAIASLIGRPMSSSRSVVIGGMTDLLHSKAAILYGAGGGLGGAVARTFAPEAGGIDVSFNLISRGDVQGRPIVDLGLDEFLRAITAGATTLFLTARAAARHMAPRGSGAILHLTSGSSRGVAPMMGSTGPADGATDALARYLAAELGPAGIRVVGIHTAAVRETLTPEKIAAVSGAPNIDVHALLTRVAQMTILRRAPEAQQVADTAAFLASDRAGAITSQMVNATCGLIAG